MKKSILLLPALLAFAACKKESEDPAPSGTDAFTTASVLHAFASAVAQDNYDDLAERSALLRDRIVAFGASLSDADLALCKQQWCTGLVRHPDSRGLVHGNPA